MTWKVRHEGSPRAVEGLTPGQVAQGLLDGRWEPTDEVMGPQDDRWVALESHPQFADVALELEPPRPKVYDDESRLDMNALIDVCLVLLVFFILTTSYAALQFLVEAPRTAEQAKDGARKVTMEQVGRAMVEIEITLAGEVGKAEPVITVRGKPDEKAEAVEKHRLVDELRGVRTRTGKSEVLLSFEDAVPFGLVVTVRDAAAEAGFTQVHAKKP